jgi:hypothetical protein
MYLFYSYEIHKVVIEFGPKHIVQIITDNESNYKKAFKMITSKFPIV